MNPWAEAIGVIAIAVLGVVIGAVFFGRTYRRAVWGAFAAVGLIAFILAVHFLHMYTLYARLDWTAASRFKYVLIIFAICLGFISPLGYLRPAWKRAMTLVILGGFILGFVGLPFVGPAIARRDIQSLPTLLDGQGLCYQSRPYTCGPAAAVTALTQLGAAADEAQIASAARTAPYLGTCFWDLYRALDRLYTDKGIECEYRRVSSLEQLPQNAQTLVVMREGFLLDHCVAVISADTLQVLVADPSAGLRWIPRSDFDQSWRHTAIVLTRSQRPLAAR